MGFLYSIETTICQRIKKIYASCSKTCKLVMFIIGIVTIIVAVVGIIVPSVTTRQVQPDPSASGMASPD